mgnify:CR=1 FL=1
MLEFIVPEAYTDAISNVCKSIAHIAEKKREENSEDYDIIFEKEGMSLFWSKILP